MTVDKMLGLVNGPKIDTSFLSSWSKIKVNQLPYCRKVALILSAAVDSFSNNIMIRAENASIGAFTEENTAIVCLLLKNKEQYKDLKMPFLETLKLERHYDLIKVEDVIPRISMIADVMEVKDLLDIKMSDLCWNEYQNGGFDVKKCLKNETKQTKDAGDEKDEELNTNTLKELIYLDSTTKCLETKMVNELYAEYLMSEKSRMIKEQMETKGKETKQVQKLMGRMVVE